MSSTLFFQFKSKEIAYTLSGSGECVFLIHGYTESKEIWENFQNQLSENYCIVCPDIPGHGESELLNVNTFDHWVEALRELMMHLNIEKATIIGHSMGGYLASHFAALYPSMINGLGLFHSSARADSTEVKESRKKTIEWIKQGKANFLSQFISDLFAPKNKVLLEEEIQILRKRASLISDEALIASQTAMANRDGHLEMLNLAEFPFLFIIGKQDIRADVNSVLTQAMMVKKASVLILQECGHMGYLEAPKETLAAISGFLKLCSP